MRRALAALALVCVAGEVEAHELTPGLARLRAMGPGRFELTWRPPRPAQEDLQLEVLAPCVVRAAFGDTRAVACPEGVVPALRRVGGQGAEIVVAGPGPDDVRSLGPELEPSAPVGVGAVLARYLGLGVQHILLGVDHLAFVLGLLLLVRGLRQAAVALTAFTVGHSVTLAGAALGLARLPGPPVEACIALSVVFVAREALRPGGRPGVPVVAAVGFGLLHGFGFAGALASLGLPPGYALPALFAFNCGVELGQLLVVGAVVVLTGRRLQAGLRRPAAVALGVGAAWLTLVRATEVMRWT